MIAYNQYLREDGTACSAVQFQGNANNEQPEHVFEILEILNAADLKAFWVDAEKTDDPAFDDDGEIMFDENDELVWRIEPEHIMTEASKEKLKVGDYIVMRDGDTYIQDGRTFEAIWTLVESTLTDLGEFFQKIKELES